MGGRLDRSTWGLTGGLAELRELLGERLGPVVAATADRLCWCCGCCPIEGVDGASESGVVSDSSADCSPDSGCCPEEVEDEEGAMAVGWMGVLLLGLWWSCWVAKEEGLGFD